MKRVRVVITCLLGVLSLVSIFYFYNQDIHNLKEGQEIPAMSNDESVEEIGTLTGSDQDELQTTNLYYSKEEEKLYFGVWYEKGSSFVKKDWYTEDGVVPFSIEVINSDGTSFTGETTGKVPGTFSTFQYVEVKDFSFAEGRFAEKPHQLRVLFYPMKSEKQPYHLPLFEKASKLKKGGHS